MADDGIVKTLLSGAVDAGGIATNAGYDLLKYISGKALKRLNEQNVRDRIVEDTGKRMIAAGMPAEQARFLARQVEQKNFLQRGAMEDVAQLADLIHREIKQMGYFPAEADALYTALVQALAAELGSNPFMDSLAVGHYLTVHPTPFARDTMFQFTQALQEPEKLAGTLLGNILKEAGLPNAQLAAGPDGMPRLTGDYTLTIEADAPDASKLHDALQRVQRGETVVVEASTAGTIRFTTGHSVLDRIQGFDRHPTALRLSPAPQVFTRRLYARARELGEVAIDASMTVFPARSGFSVTLADKPGLKFSISMTEKEIRWDFHIDWLNAPPTFEDRNVMKFLMYAAHPNGRILDDKGKQLFKLSERSEEFRRMGWVAEANLYVIDVHRYVTEELNGTFTYLLPELDQRSFMTLKDMARHARDELDGLEQTVRGTFLMTRDFIQSVLVTKSKSRLFVEMTQFLSLPASTPLKLTKDFARPKVTIRKDGKRVPRAQLTGLIGLAAEVEFSGAVSNARLHVASDEEE